MPEIIAVIPARLHSHRFPGKVLAEIRGKSLLRRTYEQVIQSTCLSRIVIAVDDPGVARHAIDFGADVVMTDPSLPSGTHRVAAALTQLRIQADIILNVQADEPCLDPACIDMLVQCLIAHPDAGVSTPIVPIQDKEEIHAPSVVKCVIDTQGRALYFSRSPIPFSQRRCSADIVYYKHIGLYCFRHRALQRVIALPQTPLQEAEDLEQLKFLEYGEQIHTCTLHTASASVDLPTDIHKVEAWLCQT